MGRDRTTIGWTIAGAFLLLVAPSHSTLASFDINVQNPQCARPELKMRGPAPAADSRSEGGACGTMSESAKQTQPAPRSVGKETRITEKDLGAKSPAGENKAPPSDRPATVRRGEVAVEGYLGASYVYGTLSSSSQGVLEGYLMRPNGGRFFVYGFPEPAVKGRVGAYDLFGNLITLQVVGGK